MTWMIGVIVAWWMVGLGAIAFVVVGGVLWRLALADLVFDRIDLP